MRVCDPDVIKDLIGRPFLDGGRGPDGFDCWGLVLEIYRRHGTTLPDYEIGAFQPERIDGAIQNARPTWREHESGEIPVPSVVVIRFNSPVFCNHCGVFIGGGRFIHAREGAGVAIDRITSPAWARRIVGFFTPQEDTK